jgi:hypothetical protein
LIYLYMGELPWKHITRDKNDKILKMKNKIEEYKQIPSILIKYMKNIRTLNFNDSPNYKELNESFSEELGKMNR